MITAITNQSLSMEEEKERDVIFIVVTLPISEMLEYSKKGIPPPKTFTIAYPDDMKREITLRVGDVITLPEKLARVLEDIGVGYIMEDLP